MNAWFFGVTAKGDVAKCSNPYISYQGLIASGPAVENLIRLNGLLLSGLLVEESVTTTTTSTTSAAAAAATNRFPLILNAPTPNFKNSNLAVWLLTLRGVSADNT